MARRVAWTRRYTMVNGVQNLWQQRRSDQRCTTINLDSDNCLISAVLSMISIRSAVHAEATSLSDQQIKDLGREVRMQLFRIIVDESEKKI